MVPTALVRPRGVRARIARSGAVFAGGVRGAVRFVANVIGTAFGV
ncbi:MAG TPA: hypothetical protein VK932_08760 [Kofleriaceae bacterium]|nr:hypothetical protein [Kofleriaceae bacterium]